MSENEKLSCEEVSNRENSPRSPRVSSRRLTFRLSNGRTVTFCGDDLTLDVIVESSEWLRAQSREAQKRNLQLGTFQRMVNDMSRAGA